MSQESKAVNKFEISAKKFKREYLEVPTEFGELVGSDMEKEPVFFKDTEGHRFIVDFYPKRGLLGGLGEWYRSQRVTPEDLILIEPVNIDERIFAISLERSLQAEEISGLFLGKEYNMVGARKYELSRNYRLPLGDLLTHIFICGVTGSGKTVLGKAIIEEAALNGIPSILIDLKGDLSSLGLMFSSLSPQEFEPWVAGAETKERLSIASAEAEKHSKNLAEFRISAEEVQRLKGKIYVKIFTPRSNRGFPVSFSSPLSAPDDPKKFYEQDPVDFNNLVASLTNAFVDRLYPGVKRTRIENERNYLYEIVHHAWLNGINLDGVKGLERLLRLVEEPPFEEIGGLPVDQYIKAENRRARLLNKINTLISGAEKMWLEGNPIEIPDLAEKKDGRTPVSIINLTELDHFEDVSFVVAQVAYKIYEWMRRLRGTDKPRLLFFIDEIGGGGGKQALFPSYPYECAAKWGLNYLVRQGRSFGVCCVFSTQNPGDIDYKGLSQCGTWIVGQLRTDRDRKKVLEGMELWGSDAGRVKINLTKAGIGDFAVKDPRGEVKFIKERWLMSYHRVVTSLELSHINSLHERE